MSSFIIGPSVVWNTFNRATDKVKETETLISHHLISQIFDLTASPQRGSLRDSSNSLNSFVTLGMTRKSGAEGCEPSLRLCGMKIHYSFNIRAMILRLRITSSGSFAFGFRLFAEQREDIIFPFRFTILRV